MEFDPFGLSVKDLIIRNVIIRSNSTGLLYMMHIPEFVTPSFGAVTTIAATPTALLLLLWLPGTIVLVIRTLTPYLACLGPLLLILLAINMIFVMPASCENTPGCPFLVPQIVRTKPLI
jgi:hypothetical protein